MQDVENLPMLRKWCWGGLLEVLLELFEYLSLQFLGVVGGFPSLFGWVADLGQAMSILFWFCDIPNMAICASKFFH